MSTHTTIAAICHGEAGTRITAALLAAGYDVTVIDPMASKNNAAPLGEGQAEAVAGADVVLSLNSRTHSLRLAEQIAPLLKEGAVFADANSGTPGMKRRLAELFPPGAFADVAVLAPVPGAAQELSLAASGSGAGKLMGLLEPSGLALDYVSDVPGEAAAREIVRSLLHKSMAAAIIDSLWAAQSLGLQDWAFDEVLEQFNASSAETAKSLLLDSAQNFKRRQMELLEVAEALRDTDYESTMTAPIDFTYGSLMHGKKIPFSKLPQGRRS
ncbi:NAD(P)-dependent oxidoreductase [Arthrobacter sp. GMC3]|uniref:NAD(P)-dependent oxidoreductase n=1 Tax=Arthrobacter sp. GMC3 TaxID=2058894 RepID=UPI000CE36E48|nr:NAD(P)-dependent oxidoreductase [Arthrobacter sp. GMC3]